jgi:Carboxypeptidase regulatory-like domain
VVDDNGQPLEGALVTLTDGKTHIKTTAITKKDGRYNFDALSFNIDYDLQARYKDLLSSPRKLSQYDHNANVVRILEVTSDAPTAAEAKK